jgi:hypothetical protein
MYTRHSTSQFMCTISNANVLPTKRSCRAAAQVHHLVRSEERVHVAFLQHGTALNAAAALPCRSQHRCDNVLHAPLRRARMQSRLARASLFAAVFIPLPWVRRPAPARYRRSRVHFSGAFVRTFRTYSRSFPGARKRCAPRPRACRERSF